MRIWNRRDQHRSTLTGHSGPIRAVTTVTPDGEQIITVAGDGTIRVWDRARGRQRRGADRGGVGPVNPLSALRRDEPSIKD